MKANYGYKDGSGEYYITIDTDLCNGCNKCVEVCPEGVLEVVEDELDPLGDEIVARVTDNHRKKIKYSCAPCKPTGEPRELPCVQICELLAISHSW
ncbi:MAG: 4Fe-4S dicluster domain-containing protein [Candidatus Hodarchaeales archaeon]